MVGEQPGIVRIALAQINLSVGDLEGNKNRIIDCIQRARSACADLVAFPELAVAGYPPEDLLLNPDFLQDCQETLSAIVRETSGIVAVIGFPYRERALYNAAAIAKNGSLVSVYKKNLLPNYGVFDEKRYFLASDVRFVYEMGRLRFAVNICEDIWEPSISAQQVSIGGAVLVINISSSPYHMDKGTLRQRMLSERARENCTAVCYVNLVGGQDELVFDGESLVFSPDGNLLARAPQFEEALLVADIELGDIAEERRKRGFKGDRITDTHEGLVEQVAVVKLGDWVEPSARPTLRSEQVPRLAPVAEVHKALVLGTRDYVRKNGFEKVVIGLSGGIDSSLVATIAVDALGPENVIGVLMCSPYTSRQSIEDARYISTKLGTKLIDIPINDIFTSYLATLKPAFADAKPDATEENIQARIRGNILMALSNKFGWLVLTTGNKSEIAVGYTTLYGDAAGGFAVIKDVPKTLVYELARFRNTLPGGPVIPESILTKPPSAELRPDQKDTDSLPPYDVLDAILEAYVEKDKSYREIVAQVSREDVVRRVIGMVEGSEYKRRQAPPGVKITPKAFGKDRRMPITNLYTSQRR